MEALQTIRGEQVRQPPRRWGSAVFALKAGVLRARRWFEDFKDGPQRWPVDRGATEAWDFCNELRSPLWVHAEPAELRFELGKVENLRLACTRIDGVVLEPGNVFSFWRQVGRASRRRGFVVGRMLQQGCVIPAVGGGLCQLSNALYGLALRSGCEIVERHAHSVRMPSAPLHDATVAWNYVDLRFRAVQRMRISATLSADELIVGFQLERAYDLVAQEPVGLVAISHVVQSCATCHEVGCFRHEGGRHEV